MLDGLLLILAISRTGRIAVEAATGRVVVVHDGNTGLEPESADSFALALS
jgi:hypothetical protein